MNTTLPRPEDTVDPQAPSPRPMREVGAQRDRKPTAGEYVLPYLFAAMETCWIDAILLGLAETGILGSNALLVPWWLPFVLLAGCYAFFHHRSRQSESELATDSVARKSDLADRLLATALIFLATLFAVWVSIYAGQFFLLDPAWLSSIPGTLFPYDVGSFRLTAVAVLAIALCRHGRDLGKNNLIPIQANKMLRFGTWIIIVWIIVRTVLAKVGVQLHDGLAVLLLISLFFCLALIVLGLSQVSFVRKVHPIGLFGSAAIQERRVLLLILGSAFLFLFMALAIGSIFDPTLVIGVGDAIGPPFNWLLRAFVYGIAFVVSPIVWLFQLFFHRFPPPKNSQVQIPKCQSKLPQHCKIELPRHANASGQQLSSSNVTPGHANASGQQLNIPNVHLANAASSWVAVALIGLVVVALVVLCAWLLRRWYQQRRQPHWEQRESLWSWSLFKQQLRALWLSILRRFFPSRRLPTQQQKREEAAQAPGLRSVREMYRRLLKIAARSGYPRSQFETPYEYSLRLAQYHPVLGPELTLITEAYASARYSGAAPADTEVVHILSVWKRLEHKWREVGTA